MIITPGEVFDGRVYHGLPQMHCSEVSRSSWVYLLVNVAKFYLVDDSSDSYSFPNDFLAPTTVSYITCIRT